METKTCRQTHKAVMMMMMMLNTATNQCTVQNTSIAKFYGCFVYFNSHVMAHTGWNASISIRSHGFCQFLLSYFSFVDFGLISSLSFVLSLAKQSSTEWLGQSMNCGTECESGSKPNANLFIQLFCWLPDEEIVQTNLLTLVQATHLKACSMLFDLLNFEAVWLAESRASVLSFCIRCGCCCCG